MYLASQPRCSRDRQSEEVMSVLPKRFVDRALLLVGVALTAYVVVEMAKGYALDQLRNGFVVRIQVGGNQSVR